MPTVAPPAFPRVECWIAGVLDRVYSDPEPPLDAAWCRFAGLQPRDETWLAILYPAGRLALYARSGDEFLVPLEREDLSRLLPTAQGLLACPDLSTVRRWSGEGGALGGYVSIHAESYGAEPHDICLVMACCQKMLFKEPCAPCRNSQEGQPCAQSLLISHPLDCPTPIDLAHDQVLCSLASRDWLVTHNALSVRVSQTVSFLGSIDCMHPPRILPPF